MAKKEIRYCPECKKKTVYEQITRDSIGKGLSLLRPMLAIATLGITEVTTKRGLVCTKCGHCIEL